jgi:phenylacetate-CoA ligase
MNPQRLERLLAVIRYAAERSPYYRERLAGFNVESHEDVRKLPFLTKRDIYENSLPASERLFTGPYENVYVFASSGTTGKKKYSFYTPAEYETAKAWQVEVLKIAWVAKGIRSPSFMRWATWTRRSPPWARSWAARARRPC